MADHTSDIARPSTKTEYAYKLMKTEILNGGLAPGTRLRLTELAQRYKISEMPIREALRMLQHDGLVVFESHRGASVVEISLQELVDIISTRTYLEVLAICEAAPYHTPKTISSLEKLADQMQGTEISSLYSEINHTFHQALFAPGRNEFLKREIGYLWDRVWKKWSRSLFEIRPEHRNLSNSDHAAIIEAIKSGDTNRVQAAALAHRERSLQAWQWIVETLSQNDGA